MKKARLFLLFTMIVSFALLLSTGCNKKEDHISSISLKDHDPSSVIEMPIGVFDYSAYSLVVTYDSGSTEEIPLTEDMIVEADLFKFYQEGKHDITVTYGEHQYVFKVAVKRSTFGALAFSKNNVFTYDGTAHTIEVEGDIPANAIVTYPVGNSFVNAGTYDVTAIVSCEGYVTARLSTTVKIERAKYDMSAVRFESKEVVYDGTSYSVAISGTLPEGVSAPTYYLNGNKTASATSVGEYEVIARFSNTNPNYEAIPDMKATLKITQAEYTVKDVDLVFKNAGGKVLSNAQTVYDGSVVTFDLNDYNKIPNRVSISFFVYDQDGNEIATSNKKTNIVNVGIYTVKAVFTLDDSKNYKPIAPIVRTFEVGKADYPQFGNIQLVTGQATYDGKEHSIVIEGTLPKDVTVSYEYYLDDKLVVGADGKPAQSVIDAGRYTVKAIFTHNNPNYKEIDSISAKLYVLQKEVDMQAVFPMETTVIYDGDVHSIAMADSIPEFVKVRYEYYLNGNLLVDGQGNAVTAVSEVGEYTVRAIFTVTNANYAPIESQYGLLSIVSPDDGNL